MTEFEDVKKQHEILDFLTGEVRRECYENLQQLLSTLRAGTWTGIPYRVYVSEYSDNKERLRTVKGAVRVVVNVNNLDYLNCTVGADTYTPTKFEITTDVWEEIQAKNSETLQKYNDLKKVNNNF